MQKSFQLLVAEKPSVARDHYQKMLGRIAGEKFVARDGYLEGQNWCITWCVGHLVTLSPMDAYEGLAGSWNLSSLPCLPDKFKLTAIEQTQKQLGIVVRLMQEAEVLVNGADAGREGNLIFDLVLDLHPELKQKTLNRLWVSSYVEKDLDQAFAQLESAQKRINLSYAARLRQRADWLVGLNATRAYTLTAGRGRLLSVGRVQTPTLNLVVARDREVESFREFFVYGVEGEWNQVGFQWILEDKIAWVEEKPLAERTKNKCQNQPATLVEWKIQNKKSFPPKPFDLTELQKEAHRRLKMTAARTLEVAQELYERKFITYPRTDSSYITESMRAETYLLAQKLGTEAHLKLMRPQSDNYSFINDKKVSDHFAILPTANPPQNLNPEQLKLYNLVKARFLVAWLIPQEWKEGVAVIQVQDEKFRASLKQETERGWKGLWEDIKEESKEATSESTEASENSGNKKDESKKNDDNFEEVSAWVSQMPSFKKGDVAPLIKLEVKEKKKSRPKYYTEATLLQAMKTAGRQIEDEELAEAMKERGLGTPATQANILETLKQRKFILEEKGYLISTPLGRMLIDKVDTRLRSAELTGEWEFKLRQVEKGELDPKTFSEGIKNLVVEVFDSLRNSYSTDFHRESEDFNEPCKKCASALERQNWGFKCSSPECNFKLPFSVAGRSLSMSEIKSLYQGEKLLNLEGFQSKRGFVFKAGVQMNSNFELELILPENPQGAFTALKHKCPACKNNLEHNAKLIRCTFERCEFTLWKTVAKKTLTLEEIEPLLKKQETPLLEGFISKAGKSFNAKLKLNNLFKTEFVFENTPANQVSLPPLNLKPIEALCPKCQSNLFLRTQDVLCQSSECGWNHSLIIAERQLSLDEILPLLQIGRSAILSGFVGKSGQKFRGQLILNQNEIRFDKGSCVLENTAPPS